MVTTRKSVLITGCTAGGIGAALAEVFLEKGYHVFATLRTPSKIQPALAGAANVTVLALDVLSSDSIAAAVESVNNETGGRLDVLVNNSAKGNMMPGLDLSIDAGREVFDVNLWAPMAMLQAFAPLLISAKGCVVNNSSANGIVPMPVMTAYNASKAALIAASETWRYELRPFGVRTIVLVTFAVASETDRSSNRVEIPESSRYYQIRDFIYHVSSGSLRSEGMNPKVYANKVVRHVEKGTSGVVWVGQSATFFHWLWWLSPASVLDKLMDSVMPFSSEMAKAERQKTA